MVELRTPRRRSRQATASSERLPIRTESFSPLVVTQNLNTNNFGVDNIEYVVGKGFHIEALITRVLIEMLLLRPFFNFVDRATKLVPKTLFQMLRFFAVVAKRAIDIALDIWVEDNLPHRPSRRLSSSNVIPSTSPLSSCLALS